MVVSAVTSVAASPAYSQSIMRTPNLNIGTRIPTVGAAPSVDIFLPAPDQKYQITSGTSFSAAYVSALAALMLEHNPALTPQALRAALTRTARDLGSPGRDDLFGAGEADAYAAVRAATETPTPPAVSAPPNEAATRAMKTGESASEPKELPGSRVLDPPVATMASERWDSGDSHRTAGQ
jgi:subtilisin family serine protease